MITTDVSINEDEINDLLMIIQLLREDLARIPHNHSTTLLGKLHFKFRRSQQTVKRKIKRWQNVEVLLTYCRQFRIT